MRQPWAWAIFHGKDVENRTQLWKHRGPLAIHAGAQFSGRGLASPLVSEARAATTDRIRLGMLSRIIGVVDLVDVHPAHPGCCDSPWAEHEYLEAGGEVRRNIAHLVLENPVEFRTPIPAVGRLGLWTPDLELLDAIKAAA